MNVSKQIYMHTLIQEIQSTSVASISKGIMMRMRSGLYASQFTRENKQIKEV